MIGVLGLGSPHGDDQIGWWIVERLKSCNLGPNVGVEKISAPGVSLMSLFRHYEQVIIVDACEMGCEPGTYRIIDETHFSDLILSDRFSTHSLGVTESVQLAQTLSLPLPRISLFLVQMEQTELMAPLSASIERRGTEMVESLLRQLKQFHGCNKTENNGV